MNDPTKNTDYFYCQASQGVCVPKNSLYVNTQNNQVYNDKASCQAACVSTWPDMPSSLMGSKPYNKPSINPPQGINGTSAVNPNTYVPLHYNNNNNTNNFNNVVASTGFKLMLKKN